MSKVIYVINNNEEKDYNYEIEEDTIIYHYSINSSSNVTIKMVKEGVTLHYYYNNINYDDNTFNIEIKHIVDNTHSELYTHGVNINTNRLKYIVNGIVIKEASKCICNQDNQIINMDNGKSTICPNLLIDNYDVDSNHAAYIGKFKDEVLFYIMSRGIDREVANRLLLEGFLINNSSIDREKIKDFILEIDKI